MIYVNKFIDIIKNLAKKKQIGKFRKSEYIFKNNSNSSMSHKINKKFKSVRKLRDQPYLCCRFAL